MISFSAVKIHQSIHKNIFPCRVHSSRFYTVNTLVKKYKTYGSLQSYNCHWNSPYTPLHTVQCCTLLLFIFQNVNILTDKSASHCHWSTFISFININHFPPIPDLSELRPWPVWACVMLCSCYCGRSSSRCCGWLMLAGGEVPGCPAQAQAAARQPGQQISWWQHLHITCQHEPPSPAATHQYQPS